MIEIALLVGAFVALVTEVLSLAGALDRAGVLAAWMLAGVFAGLTWGPMKGAARRGRTLAEPQEPQWKTFKPLEWILLAGVAVYVILLLVTALAAPPNTNDSLQYHMSRVAHWAQNASVAHYATPIERQVWMPPLAEYAVLQLYLLAGNDRLVNLVQWAAMLACLGGLVQIGRRVKLGPLGLGFMLVFTVTLRMGVLQASSTQTDYVTALWLVCLVYYAVLASQKSLTLLEWALAGTAVGLGALTKGTFYVFAAPFLAWMTVATWRQAGSRGARAAHLLSATAVGAAAVLVLNAGSWVRNAHTYGSLLGPPADTQSLVNEQFGFGVLFSNTIRNLSLHVGTPYGEVNGLILRGVSGVHQILGLDVNDPGTTFDPFRIKRSLHEDFAGNPYHLGVLGFGLAWMMGQGGRLKDEGGRWKKSLLPFVLSWVGGFLLFSWLFKWQSTGSRLQLPWFVLAGLLAGWLAEQTAWLKSTGKNDGRGLPASWLVVGVSALLLWSSLTVLLTNLSRPLLPRGEDRASLFNRTRLEWLFTNSPEVADGYISLAGALLETDCRQVGMLIDSSAPEYPLWVLLADSTDSETSQELRLEHLQAGSALQAYIDPGFQPCAVVCIDCSTEKIPPGYFLMSQHPAGLRLYYVQR